MLWIVAALFSFPCQFSGGRFERASKHEKSRTCCSSVSMSSDDGSFALKIRLLDYLYVLLGPVCRLYWLWVLGFSVATLIAIFFGEEMLTAAVCLHDLK